VCNPKEAESHTMDLLGFNHELGRTTVLQVAFCEKSLPAHKDRILESQTLFVFLKDIKPGIASEQLIDLLKSDGKNGNMYRLVPVKFMRCKARFLESFNALDIVVTQIATCRQFLS
jgi:hypothetical protein